MQVLGLLGLLLLALVLPLSMKHVEEELEAFFLVMGSAAVSLQGLWSFRLVGQVFGEPLAISATVLAVGLLFRRFRLEWRAWVRSGLHRMGTRWLALGLVGGLGLLASVITSIVAALVLAEAVSALRLSRRAEIRLVVLACASIGVGSALTPLGGPLSTIAMSRLQDATSHPDFFYLARLLGPWVLPMITVLALSAALLVHGKESKAPGLTEDKPEGARDIVLRTLKVYGFVAGLVLVGKGFAPLAERYLGHVPALGLYWVNSLSAILDNATLTAAEMGPQLSSERVRDLLLGLLIAGVMLVPGNIPNIICAAKLKIRAKEWAAVGVPVGLTLMVAVYLVLAL